MKTLKLIGLFILAISITVSGQTNNVPAGWESLIKDDFSISHPAEWELDAPGQMGTTFLIFTPLSSSEDLFRDNLNLLVQDLSDYDLDLKAYTELSLNQIKTIMADVKIIESNTLKANDRDYHKLIYTGKQGDYNLKFEQRWWVVGKTAYVLTFTCEEDQFDNFNVAGAKVLDSFRIN